MILSDFFDQVNSAYRGSDDDAPVSGTPDHDLWLFSTNRKLAEYAADGKQARSSLFATRSIGTVSSGTQTYSLTSDLIQPEDTLTVTTTGGQDIKFKIVKPGERDRFRNAVYLSGANPQQVTFVDTILPTSAIVGGTIKLDGYWKPTDLANDNDVIPVDDPYWLVYAVASELAFNDITYEEKYPDLVNKANNLYSQMALNNRRGTSTTPRTVRYAVRNKIGGANRG